MEKTHKPINIINTKGLTRDEWLKERKNGVGGSDSATILGLNRYASAYELWLEKIGEVESEQVNNDSIHFGNVLEDIVAKEFEERSGYKVRKNNFLMAHPDYYHIRANIDREIVGENAILECKTTSLYNAKEWEGESVPPHYLIQVQHYMAVTGADFAYIAVLIGGQKFVYKRIDRHDGIIKAIIELANEFYNVNVLNGVAPKVGGSEAASNYLDKQYPDAIEGAQPLPAKYEKDFKELMQIKDKIKLLKERENEIKNNVKVELKEYEKGEIKGFTVEWKQVYKQTPDVKKLKKEYPHIYHDVLEGKSYRRMVIKEKGE